jgi:tetratricopeptide (TPR) repeat protein
MPRRTLIAPTLGLLVVLASCGHDAAERLYYDALRGEETGMTREQQVALLGRAIALSPRRAWYWETRATYEIDLHDFARAHTDLDTAIALSDRPYVRFMRGLVWCQSGKPAQSLADFDAAISGQPGNWQFYRGRSLARAAVGDSAGALADAEVLVANAPQTAEAWYARGVALSMRGRYVDAIRDFDEALRRRPELAYPLLARADAYARSGDATRAAADLTAYADQWKEESGCAPCLDPFRY